MCALEQGNIYEFDEVRVDVRHVSVTRSGQPVPLEPKLFDVLRFPDNDRIAFAGERQGVWDIWVVSRRTRIARQVTSFSNTSGYVRWPSASPQGQRIVFEPNQRASDTGRPA
jgi:hypothetical protein